MRGMGRELSYEDQKSIRSDAEVVLALEGMVSRLKADRRVRYRGRKVSLEAVVNAGWLMLADLPMERLVPLMVEWIGRLEALLDAGDARSPADLAARTSIEGETPAGRARTEPRPPRRSAGKPPHRSGGSSA